jgi:hypothetical protein
MAIGIFYRHLGYLMIIWYILCSSGIGFGIMFQEKSGNPDADAPKHSICFFSFGKANASKFLRFQMNVSLRSLLSFFFSAAPFSNDVIVFSFPFIPQPVHAAPFIKILFRKISAVGGRLSFAKKR